MRDDELDGRAESKLSQLEKEVVDEPIEPPAPAKPAQRKMRTAQVSAVRDQADETGLFDHNVTRFGAPRIYQYTSREKTDLCLDDDDYF